MTPLTSGRFPEWGDIRHDDPVRQGDVLQALPGEGDIWRDLLVVLTADCDLARSKHGGALTCVPVIAYSEYLLRFRYDKVRESVVSRLVDRLAAVHESGGEPADQRPRISAARMRQWVIEADLAVIIQALGLTGDAEEQFSTLAGAVRELSGPDPSALRCAVKRLANAKTLLGEVKDREKAKASIAADFASILKTLPGDALFLNQVSPEHTTGYVAYLRRVVEVGEQSVTRSASRIPHEARYLRITRLRAPYVYALSQQFASVFSSIGLPPEYESARDAVVASIRILEV